MISKIVIAAGGTGGHLFPAIAVADELRKMNSDTEIRFIGAKGKIEENIVPKKGYELKTIEVKGFNRSFSLNNIDVILKLKKAIKESKQYLKEFRPEIVFGTGGFVSAPVLWASKKLGIPTVIEEGNYYPGITVKLLSRKIDKVIINFDETRKFLKRQDNIQLMSYPVRENLRRYSKERACNFFKLDISKKILFVMGGSQGASSINNVLLKHIGKLVNENIQLIWQTGRLDYEFISERVRDYSGIFPFKFIDEIDYAYSAADLILCRAGISTVMELAYFGAAAIFVPYAFASENHQEKNAKAIADSKAAEIVLDKNLDIELTDKVVSLINDEELLNDMRKNIIKFADKNAASKIAHLLTKLASKN